MAISHELSSEIATALFTAKERSQGELDDLKNMVLEIHSALEQLTDKTRQSHGNANLDLQPLRKAFGQQP